MLFLLFCMLPSVYCCVATVPGGTTTTTTISPVTTTAGTVTTTTAGTVTTTTSTTTTTTTTAASCTSCTTDQITFQPANGNPESIDAMFRVEPADPVTGCSKLTAICDAVTANFVSFMQFNVGQGGPIENANMQEVTEASLDCVNGQWLYMMQRVVTSVECSEAPG